MKLVQAVMALILLAIFVGMVAGATSAAVRAPTASGPHTHAIVTGHKPTATHIAQTGGPASLTPVKPFSQAAKHRGAGKVKPTAVAA